MNLDGQPFSQRQFHGPVDVDQYRAARRGECQGVVPLVIVHRRGEWDKDCRNTHRRELGQRRTSGPAHDQPAEANNAGTSSINGRTVAAIPAD